MRTNAFYLSRDGGCTHERTKIRTRLFEEPDGYHPITNDSFWQDAERRLPSIIVFIEGVRGAIGATMEQDDVSNVLYEVKIKELAFRKQNVSKMWQRAFARAVAWVMRYGVMLFIVALIGVSIYRSLTEGGL